MSNSEPTNPKRFLTEVEVSALTGIPKMTLRSHRHLRRGLPYVKVGHLVRYDCVEVEKYLAERTIRPEAS
jgi:predicted DNA-binding transcriptional regulator AlpA